MNEGQKKFHDFIMERVREEDWLKVEDMLKESFDKQEKGTFDADYLSRFIPDLLNLIKPEHKEEVNQICKNFQNQQKDAT